MNHALEMLSNIGGFVEVLWVGASILIFLTCSHILDAKFIQIFYN